MQCKLLTNFLYLGNNLHKHEKRLNPAWSTWDAYYQPRLKGSILILQTKTPFSWFYFFVDLTKINEKAFCFPSIPTPPVNTMFHKVLDFTYRIEACPSWHFTVFEDPIHRVARQNIEQLPLCPRVSLIFAFKSAWHVCMQCVLILFWAQPLSHHILFLSSFRDLAWNRIATPSTGTSRHTSVSYWMILSLAVTRPRSMIWVKLFDGKARFVLLSAYWSVSIPGVCFMTSSSVGAWERGASRRIRVLAFSN